MQEIARFFFRERVTPRLQDEAGTLGVELLINQVAKPEEIGSAIDAAKSFDASALNVLSSATLYNNRQIIFERAATLRLAAKYEWPRREALLPMAQASLNSIEMFLAGSASSSCAG
jgi:hypothetical protein